MKARTQTLYLWAILFMQLLFFAVCFFSRGNYFMSVFFGDIRDSFADFFKCMFYWYRNPYEEGYGNYPALGMLLFKFAHHFIPENLSLPDGLAYRNVSYSWHVFIIYNIICVYLTVIGLSKKCRLGGGNTKLLSAVILLSTPVLFSLERGNLVNLAFACTVFYYGYYDDKKLKHLAFIFLAIAAGIKIYPAIFGLILVKKRKILDTIELFVLGVSAFVLPFFYYGIDSIFVFVKSLYAFSAGMGQTRYGYNYALNNIFSLLEAELGFDHLGILVLVTKIALVIFMIWVLFVTKEEWIWWLMLFSMMIVIPSVSDEYMVLFMIIPFLEFLNSNKKDWLAGICFALILIPFPFPVIDKFSSINYKLSYSYLLYFVSFYLLFIYVGINVFRDDKKGVGLQN